MNGVPSTEESLVNEFQSLGKNLMEALRAAWEAPESRRVQEKLVTGLNELGSTLKREADYFASSSTGQQIKTGIEQVGEQLGSAETQETIRNELLRVLRSANIELEHVIDRWTDQVNKEARTTEETVESQQGTMDQP